MSSGIWNITAEQGATWNPTLTYRDSTGALVNLTGYTARMQVRDGFEASAATLDLTTENGGITLGGAAGTIAPLATATQMTALSAADASKFPPNKVYVYDLELINGAVITRLLQGTFTVVREVTR